VLQFEKEASQTRDYYRKERNVRAAGPDSSLRQEGLLRTTIKL
jgi:hypothetical protein